MPALRLRDLPKDVHAVLARRASVRGTSLERYAFEVLCEHCSLPTLDEWLADEGPGPGSMTSGEKGT
jgi:hypothetical protein